MKKGSRNSLNRQVKRRKGDSIKNGCFGRAKYDTEVIRFDDVSALVVRAALVAGIIAANMQSKAGNWRSADAVDVLDLVYKHFLEFEVSGGGTYADLFKEKNARLVVAIISDVSMDPTHRNIPHNRGAFSGERILAFSVPVLSSAKSCTDRTINLTEQRWKTAHRKFSLPGGRWVRGPFLVIAAIDNDSGLTLRARIWPIWTSSDNSCFGVVRSAYERHAANAIHLSGGICFMPTHRNQLVQLQEAFGSRWRGNLMEYPFLPDAVIFPEPGEYITVLEVFGLTAFKKYAERKTVKEAAISQGLLNGSYSFRAIQTRDFRLGDPERIIGQMVAAWYEDRANCLWKRAA